MEAGRLRLRPILMTAFAFILGVVPLMIATGAGAASRQSIGTTVFGGMLAATVLTLIFVPVFYAVIERLRERARQHGQPPIAAARPSARAQASRPNRRRRIGHEDVGKSSLGSIVVAAAVVAGLYQTGRFPRPC